MIVKRAIRRLRRILNGMLDASFPRIMGFVLARKMDEAATVETPQFADGVAGSPTPPPPSDSGIPRIIFQTWKTKQVLPANYGYWASTLRGQNPDYAYVLWDDDDNRRFVQTHFAWFMPFYDRFPKEIFRADAVRLFFLFFHGGFYVDMDSECLRPLDDLRFLADVLVCRMGWDTTFDESIPNAVMASRPFQALWILAITMVMEKMRNADDATILRLGPVAFTGPILLKEAVDFYLSASPAERAAYIAPTLALLGEEMAAKVVAGKISILPPRFWFPIDWTNPFHRIFRAGMLRHQRILTPPEARRLFPESHIVSYWTHSWSEKAKASVQ